MSNTKAMSELKKRALLAKQRLRMGYWQNLERERKALESAGTVDERTGAEMVRERVRRDEMLATDARRAMQEEQLYAKVCRILDEDADTLSPIGQLIDKEKYAAMDDGARQKYILELSEKFRTLSKRYYAEHSKTGHGA